MTAAPLRMADDAEGGLSARMRVRSPANMRFVRHRWMVAIAKRLLPVVALALLSLIALWPELSSDSDRARLAYRRDSAMPQSGEMSDASYHGVDEHGRPYTMTATTARQISPERINLTDPKADMNLESGNWLMVQSRKGVYLQHAGALDLSGDVKLYRDDGTTLLTSSAAVDLKAGAAAGAEMVHAEGPFGTLDAQGFALTDKGEVIQFSGPGRLVLNAAQRDGSAGPAGGTPQVAGGTPQVGGLRGAAQ